MKHSLVESPIQSQVLLRRCRVAPLALLAALGCAPDDSATEILYTEYGIAHIRAADYESLGYAHGYAQARDNACDIELGMLGFSGRLSRYFGPDAPSNSLAMGAPNSLASDLYYQGLIDRGVVEQLVVADAPLGPRPEVRELVSGYVRGFNRLLAEAPELACIDAEWLRPMTEIDVYRRAYAVATFLGQGIGAGVIASAEPPIATPNAPSSIDPTPLVSAELRRSKERLGRPGSNAIGLGSDVTATGYGMNVANPHLKWDGDMRWWQAQLTIEGELDVSGAGLIGLPLIVMGHTESVAFSITTAEETQRFTLFELELVDGSPTTYVVDGQPEAMLRRDVEVQVKRPDGSLDTVSKAQWWTRFGPVMGPEFGLPWTAGGSEGPGRAYVFADPNASNLRMLNTWFGFDHARDVDDILAAIRETQGVPWWTVVAADAQGETLFSQIQVVANVPDEHLEHCLTPLGRAAIEGPDHLIILDGSRSACAWRTDPDAVEPGIFGPGTLEEPRMPVLFSSGYVANSNESHWLPNTSDRIEGMPRIIGDEGTERSLRARHTLRAIEEQLSTGPFTREAMQELVLSNRSEAAELAVSDTLAMCQRSAGASMTSSDGQSIDVTEACSVLTSWDRRMDATSRGALLFDRYWRRAMELVAAEGQGAWTLPFDAEDAIGTPSGLNVDDSVFARALADATSELAALNMSLSAPFGDHQFIVRGGVQIPLGGAGGPDGLGVFNILNAEWNPESGYTGPVHGSTYIHVVSFDGTECPDTVTLLTYSQSNDPASPHHFDQTELYSEKRWVTQRFCRDDILASPVLERIRLD